MSSPVIDLARAREVREWLGLLTSREPVDRVAALLDRHAAGLLDFGLMLHLFAVTGTPLPAELEEGADA